MRRQEEPGSLTVRETLALLPAEDLKPLLALVGSRGKGRKAELVDQLAAVLENPSEIRALYDELDDLAKKAIQEAAHDPQGAWHARRFEAKYGRRPDFGGFARYHGERQPTRLRLFFPRGEVLAADLRAGSRSSRASSPTAA
jgi:hypothetical protein